LDWRERRDDDDGDASDGSREGVSSEEVAWERDLSKGGPLTRGVSSEASGLGEVEAWSGEEKGGGGL